MDSKHLYIYKQNGVGQIICEDCGNIEYDVLSFTHGFGKGSCSTYGVQCQECGAFDRHRSFNEADFADVDVSEPEVAEVKKPSQPKTPREGCPKCHSLKVTNSNPVFCPKCKSYNVKYECEYVT